MPRDLEPSLNTRNFTLAALQKELRLDSRSLAQTRPLTLSFGDNIGNAFVQLGKTKSFHPPPNNNSIYNCRLTPEIGYSHKSPPLS